MLQRGDSARVMQSFWDGVAAAASEPALMLDDAGRVTHMTASAGRLLDRSDALRLVDDRLRCDRAEVDRDLQATIGRAVSSPGASGGVRLPHRSGRSALIAIVAPLPPRPGLGLDRTAALVRVVDPLAMSRRDEAVYTEAFDLTARESDLATRLLEGHSVESAAVALAVSLPTARMHLRRLLAKTQTTRQSDLIRLLSRL